LISCSADAAAMHARTPGRSRRTRGSGSAAGTGASAPASRMGAAAWREASPSRPHRGTRHRRPAPARAPPASASAVRAPTRPAFTVDVWPWIISVRSDPAAAGRSAPRRRPSGDERGSPQRKRSRSAVSRSLPAPPKTTLVITRRTIRLTRGTAGNGSPRGHVSSSRPAIAPIVSRWRAEWSRSSGGPITPRKSLCSGSSRTSSDVVPTMGVSSASCA
jgi:hypothetical protein